MIFSTSLFCTVLKKAINNFIYPSFTTFKNRKMNAAVYYVSTAEVSVFCSVELEQNLKGYN